MSSLSVPPADYAEIALAVRDLAVSAAFFEKLGFLRLAEAGSKALRMTDHRINLLLRAGAFASPRIQYFSRHSEAAEQTLRDPNGVCVLLLNGEPPAPRPVGNSTAICGRFGELSIATHNLTIASDFWLNRGLQIVSRGDKPYPWLMLDDGNVPVGLHQTVNFAQPALTFFSADAPRRIRAMKAAGFKFLDEYEDGGETAHGVLQTPDGQGIFVFQS